MVMSTLSSKSARCVSHKSCLAELACSVRHGIATLLRRLRFKLLENAVVVADGAAACASILTIVEHGTRPGLYTGLSGFDHCGCCFVFVHCKLAASAHAAVFET